MKQKKGAEPMTPMASLASLADLREDREECEVVLSTGAAVKIGCLPNVMNSAFIERLEGMTLDEALLKLIADWTLRDEPESGNETVPLTAEDLRRVPMHFKRRVYNAIKDTLLPN